MNIYEQLNRIDDQASLTEDQESISDYYNNVRKIVPKIVDMINKVKHSGKDYWRSTLEDEYRKYVEVSILIHPEGYIHNVSSHISRFTFSYRSSSTISTIDNSISVTEDGEIVPDIYTGTWSFYRNNETGGFLNTLALFLDYFPQVKKIFNKEFRAVKLEK